MQNGSPYLFKDALDSARRMRLYLSGGVNNVSLIIYMCLGILV